MGKTENRELFVRNPDSFLNTEIPNLEKDEELGDCLFGYAYDAMNVHNKPTFVVDPDGEPSTPHGVDEASQAGFGFFNEYTAGGRRKQRKNMRGGEHPKLKMVIKLAMLVALLTSVTGVSYIGYECIRNLMNLYGFSPIAIQLVKSTYEIMRTVCKDAIHPGAALASDALVNFSRGASSILVTLGIGVKDISLASGRAVQMAPLFMAGMYLRNIRQLPMDLQAAGGSLSAWAQGIIDTLGGGFESIRGKLNTMRGNIRGAFNAVEHARFAATESARGMYNEYDGRIDRAADRLMEMLNEGHRDELEAFFTGIGQRVEGARVATANAADATAGEVYRNVSEFVRAVVTEMFEGILVVGLPDIEEESALGLAAEERPTAEGEARRREYEAREGRPLSVEDRERFIPPLSVNALAAAELYADEGRPNSGNQFGIDGNDVYTPRPNNRYPEMLPPPPKFSKPSGGKRSLKRRKTRRKKSRRR
jgi:hypothetical protein